MIADLEQRVADLPTDMMRLSFMVGQWAARVDDFHTCEQQIYRNPWPPAEGCHACDASLQKWAKRFRLELPLLLIGRQAVIEEIDRQIGLKVEQARINRSLGSGI